MGEEIKELQPHQQRVVDEFKELEDKFKKLGAFILDSPIYSTLPQEEKDDMQIQYDAMEQYYIVLERRISRF